MGYYCFVDSGYRERLKDGHLVSYDRGKHGGGPEADRERQFRAEGIPVSPEHQASLESVAEELGVAVPW